MSAPMPATRRPHMRLRPSTMKEISTFAAGTQAMACVMVFCPPAAHSP